MMMNGACQNNNMYKMPGQMQQAASNGQKLVGGGGGGGGYYFQMPLHYPRYKKSDYESMPEWKLDYLLTEYGLPLNGDLSHKRNFAMGTFLWPSQY
ncbi:hypothetical protein BVC80_9079g50 [Macleaya cordata]|uniref:DUF7722 domain-containing protein n=1 Tax=Macleaya cordata TaxID=56857 RepID=A0A200PUM9_MACCD|nr:hypothetical protein BVC80_9079g50 [Macleaya cordata]